MNYNNQLKAKGLSIEECPKHWDDQFKAGYNDAYNCVNNTSHSTKRYRLGYYAAREEILLSVINGELTFVS